ncbi:hypothetical protein LU699_13165 [Luteimonas fraxinea]|uniref:hypothetical protein n=1 Tax=Luteimonas fraxinea TaxID=2901869 RepID=UPI001E30EA66|nr:hypothetical protein [Luteimonas fraxinea]UHH09239.1 hypothetical protein LU699_13165 [Luteimonas fraxinea]
MTNYQAATARYVGSAERQLTDLPADRRFDATRQNLGSLRSITAQDRETLLKLHATTTGYMSALAQLAGEDAYSLAPDIQKVSGAIQASSALGIDATQVSAYGNIAQRVSDWALEAVQARSVKAMVERNGADIDKLLEAMQRATTAYGAVLDQEVASYELISDYRAAQWSARLPGDSALTPERREVIDALLRRSARVDLADQQQALREQQAAAAGLERVRKSHQLMMENADRLRSKDIQRSLRQATSDLKSIRQSLSTL